MKRLVLDHFRRWAWLLTLGAILEFGLGWLIAQRPDDPFEFWIFLLALWSGALLLNFDLQRGIVRVVAVLPLTARQIGRSWWVATVAVPAVASAALLFLGGGTGHYVEPEETFPAGRLALASLFVLPWLGTTFTSIYGMNNDVVFGNWRQRASATGFGLLSSVMLFGGMLTLEHATKQPVKLAIFLGLGAVLITAGWLRAERFVLGRASFRLPALHVHFPQGQYRAPAGHGGIPFLVRTYAGRAFLVVTAMVALMALLLTWHGFAASPEAAVGQFATLSSFMSALLILFLYLLPVVRQLRYLRSLPVSSSRLALVLLGITVLPLAGLGGLVAGAAGLLSGIPAAVTVLKTYTWMLALTSLCVCLAAWRGEEIQVWVLQFVLLCVLQWAPIGWETWLQHPPHSPGQLGSVASGVVCVAFLLTRLALRRSTHAYRVVPGTQVNLFGDATWGSGR
ncbi:MAG: hypothetical protein KGS61_17460 [Verrucomicrobia bacterium]|nr:hypothetical protein [Verrucomicrobiota bacterium]